MESRSRGTIKIDFGRFYSSFLNLYVNWKVPILKIWDVLIAVVDGLFRKYGDDILQKVKVFVLYFYFTFNNNIGSQRQADEVRAIAAVTGIYSN